MPTSLPLSCLTMAPRLDILEMHNRKPLSEMNFNGCSDEVIRVSSSPSRKPAKMNDVDEGQRINHDIKHMLYTLKEQLAAVLKAKPAKDVPLSAGT